MLMRIGTRYWIWYTGATSALNSTSRQTKHVRQRVWGYWEVCTCQTWLCSAKTITLLKSTTTRNLRIWAAWSAKWTRKASWKRKCVLRRSSWLRVAGSSRSDYLRRPNRRWKGTYGLIQIIIATTAITPTLTGLHTIQVQLSLDTTARIAYLTQMLSRSMQLTVRLWSTPTCSYRQAMSTLSRLRKFIAFTRCCLLTRPSSESTLKASAVLSVQIGTLGRSLFCFILTRIATHSLNRPSRRSVRLLIRLKQHLGKVSNDIREDGRGKRKVISIKDQWSSNSFGSEVERWIP